MNGEFTQNLKSGGKLHVTSSDWHIEYYFAGPDMRYNGTFKRIYSNEIDKYIKAWKNNFDKYTVLKEQIPKGGEYTAVGEMGMSIGIGSWHEGVCITSYHMALKSRQEIERVIDDYENAKTTALKLQAILKDLK